MNASTPLAVKLIVALLCVSLVSLGLSAWLNDYKTRTALTDHANQTLFAAASQTADNLDTFIETNLKNVKIESQLPILSAYLALPSAQRAGSSQETEVANILETLGRRDKLFISSYALLDAAGQNVIDTAVSNIGRDESHKDYFRKPVASGLPYISPVQFSGPTEANEAVLYFSSPVFAPFSEESLGVLRVAYKATILQQRIVRNNDLVGRYSFAILLDENYFHLAHGQTPALIYKSVTPLSEDQIARRRAKRRLPARPADQLSTNLPDFEEGLKNSLRKPYFTTHLAPSKDKLYSVAVTVMETQPWFVVFVQPRELFLAPIWEQTRTTLFLVIAITGGVVMAAFGISQVLAAPLIQLTDVVARFAAGQLDIRSHIRSEDETGLLAHNFNTMAEQVVHLLHNLEIYNHDLEDEINARKRTEQALQEHRQQLEKEIGERTQALTLTNRRLQQEINERKRIEEQLRWWNEYWAALHQTTLGLMSRLDLDDLLEAIIIRAGQLLGARHGYIYLVDAEKNELALRIGVGIFDRRLRGRVKPGEGVPGQVWQTGKPLHIADYDAWPGRASDFPYDLIKSSLGMPLQSGDQTIGVIGVAYDDDAGRALQEDEMKLFSRFAESASIALDNARLYTAVQQELAGYKQTQAALKKAKEAAEATNQARSALLANITHELRPPLKAIIDYSKALQEEAHDLGYAVLVPDFKRIWQAADHLLKIINNLLDLSKIEAGKMSLYPELFDVPNLIGDVVVLIQRLVEQKDNVLHVHCPADLGTMYADPIKVRQILFNLLSNAAKFTECGIINLTVRRETVAAHSLGNGQPFSQAPSNLSNRPLKQTASKNVEQIIFSVSDTGVGISPTQLESIFEPFIQADASTPRKYNGIGLGLAVSYRLCHMMGGYIRVESKPNEGSNFIVYLPVKVDDVSW